MLQSLFICIKESNNGFCLHKCLKLYTPFKVLSKVNRMPILL